MGEHSPADQRLTQLRDRVAADVAVEDVLIEALSDRLRRERRMTSVDVAEIESFIRTHRVGLIKLRALMRAHGIDV